MTNETWGQIREELLKSVGKNNYVNWIEPLEFDALDDDGVATFLVPTQFMGNWVSRNFGEQILNQLSSAGAPVTRVAFAVPETGIAAPKKAAKATKAKLDDATIAKFQRELGAMGYRFQFVTLAGFHSLNHGMFELACGYRDRGMAAYSELQAEEFAAQSRGYTATRHQREVGTGYFDEVAQVISGGCSSTLALEDSTEEAQFK